MTRIISGTARGRKLKVPPSGTRPTSDRAKEGLFSSLQVRFGFQDAVVLDLFAGSGALGLEAASRGAAHVTLVENNPSAAAIIRHNAALIKHPDIVVEEMKVSTYVKTAPQRHFDIVLADPPYELDTQSVVEMLEALQPLLIDGAVVVVERHVDSEHTPWPRGYEPTPQKLKKRTFGIARMDMAVFDRATAVQES
ncbi:16S rRNA (guanine(966)-N(2))-methyltransferase RsmD [Corynebacterium sp. sy017]|uniref:16S rRNA (guanine(966)-N(2))-methyltransferase RsmD n=1 Tax=unclassified Corynebacterium TaxID=2624378 RepID=UPI0011872BAD|nr:MULTISPECIES: 16S rRNA (guanine(966)-N(2))-methyltransferase RsmD [unclassified Corynebacterium]MBP3089162.1 16S rRNA (guanine(966)-N(2))-methyltransferase RsmD [Corynebacterium sp. sy017]QDZ42515.1 16S rRNA (guanine(966)-N(2))-methyltransferase RsmD [Corynebacterium sp. sy039]TSD91474.1 16S rRNA (guanine(966)-N(2))-methyltransferase RsmD [Corynebacterium sp. SY003]